MRLLARLLLLLIIPLAMTSCSTKFPRLTAPDAEYRKALEETAGQRPDDEDAALQGVIDLFADFSMANLQANTRNVYADTFFFRDGFKKFTEIGPLEKYMVHSAKPLRSCTFAFAPPIKDGHDYYLRWTMRVNLMRDKPERIEEAIGLSHLRFNKEGKVIFQQDYWDPTDVLYRRIPIANGLIGYVRSKL